MRLQRKRHTLGFTLVEIITVLVILGVLMAVAFPLASDWIKKAEKKRLTAACRECVVAAQTLVAERYAATGTKPVPPTDAEVRELAGVTTGTVSGVTVGTMGDPTKDSTDAVLYLTYFGDKGGVVTYVNPVRNTRTQVKAPPYYVFSDGGIPWEKGITFSVGDLLVENGLIFRCLASHKTGSRSNTRNPTVKSNKGSWEVVGTVDGNPPPYNATVRFAVGFTVMYNGNLYQRTDYNLTGGQTPYSKSSSRYWIKVT